MMDEQTITVGGRSNGYELVVAIWRLFWLTALVGLAAVTIFLATRRVYLAPFGFGVGFLATRLTLGQKNTLALRVGLMTLASIAIALGGLLGIIGASVVLVPFLMAIVLTIAWTENVRFLPQSRREWLFLLLAASILTGVAAAGTLLFYWFVSHAMEHFH